MRRVNADKCVQEVYPSGRWMSRRCRKGDHERAAEFRSECIGEAMMVAVRMAAKRLIAKIGPRSVPPIMAATPCHLTASITAQVGRCHTTHVTLPVKAAKSDRDRQHSHQVRRNKNEMPLLSASTLAQNSRYVDCQRDIYLLVSLR